jgi:hypothetical protein
MYRCDRQSELCPDAGRYSRLELPPFMKVRVNLTQPISRGIDGFVGVDNLTNVQRGELLAVVPSRGRTVFVGARFGR